MLQSSVEGHGELAVIHIDGRFSHAARKGPLLDAGGGLLGGTYVEWIEPATVTDDELAAAEQVLDSFGRHSGINQTPLYSRVDLVTADNGSARVPRARAD